MTDWTNPQDQVTDHFTVSDACILHQWKRLANESDGMDEAMQEKLTALCQNMEQVRSILGCPINVHCMFRSPAYNQLIGAPANDVHSMGMACDFDCNPHMSTDDVKAALMPQLAALGLRMENNGPGATWVHLDNHPVMNARFFNP
jgi:uncharacterized protein YcbK (DUF882 family)